MSHRRKIYLDVCAYNRPFDNQLDRKIALEAEGVIAILMECLAEHFVLVSSDIVKFEVSLIPDTERKNAVGSLSSLANTVVEIDDGVIENAKKLEELSISPFDALHISCAEKGGVEFFITTDYKLIRLCEKHSDSIKLSAVTPLVFAAEEIENEN